MATNDDERTSVGLIMEKVDIYKSEMALLLKQFRKESRRICEKHGISPSEELNYSHGILINLVALNLVRFGLTKYDITNALRGVEDNIRDIAFDLNKVFNEGKEC